MFLLRLVFRLVLYVLALLPIYAALFLREDQE
jgi:hypothetical protein